MGKYRLAIDVGGTKIAYGIFNDENEIIFRHRTATPFEIMPDEFTEKLVKEYDIRPVDCKYTKIRNLSGGNQQKLIIGREIANDPELLIAVQPTRGLDVGAIEYVHKTLINLRDKGKAILLISLELDEILSVSDKIGVIYDGSINNVGLLMAGGNKND